jgi:acyl-coenzyme A synthetase/AMP-(fatty) acid ligase
VAVIGQSNEMYGEVVTAIVVPKAADANQPVDIDCVSECFELTENLKEFLNARLARYKQPRVYHMVERLPRNLMGKV